LTVKTIIKISEYHDSVSLMLVARELAGLDGVKDAAVVMATEANKSILEEAGLLTDEAKAATANDLVIAVLGDSDEAADAALDNVQALFAKKSAEDEAADFKPKTIRGALSTFTGANVAVISVAGRYATDEAWEALTRGLHVLLFSDNVSLEDEIALKEYARDHGLLLMGPGAGTAILNNIALGFANVIPAGNVGVVSAAGTGLQEVSTLVAKSGLGITQGIGTGGRDLKKDVGGIMMLEGLKSLQQDPATEVIALVSKPPAPEVVDLILAQIAKSDKLTVVCFMGGDMSKVSEVKNAIPARTLQEGGILAAQAAGADVGDIETMIAEETKALQVQSIELQAALNSEQKYLRGLFSGGTLCYEAQVIWRDMLDDPVYSNAPLPGEPALKDSTKSQEHTTVDLGEEEFTVGRPHPMIDNDLRIRRLLQEAADPEVGVIIMDVVIGYGAHPDPAAELGSAVEDARQIAEDTGRKLHFVASVTGTEQDPQGLQHTIKTLKRFGVIVCDSNAAAARLTAMIVNR
jgi:succinyl-CoA synthetase alpha subunit